MLQGPDTILRAACGTDLSFLMGLRNDVELQLALMAIPRPNTEDQTRQWILRRSEDPHGAFFVISSRSADQPRGFVQLVDIDPWHGRARLGICVAPEHQGLGYARQALVLLETYAYLSLGLYKLTLEVLASNERAIALYGQAGYRRAGLLEGHHRLGSSRLDVLLMEKRLEPAHP